ncbi:helicase [Virgibacillus profundi]|uniref:Helicase n=1 Tax=Virgibacillus profundi TaxID=2024555 RepID=A0A2A2IEX9_9BACI|nr:helicase [Virgibacillus profundi]PAV29710.1 helicase [Virgibacillus profundi]PXY53882.1 helicase [Virgibacillus profundi]
MNIEHDNIYPDCLSITRTVEVGGLTKSQLIQILQQHFILMNEYGERLFADDNFTTSAKAYRMETVELTVRNLGLTKGATTAQLFNKASQLGLGLCPLELAPYLRLEYLDQPEGNSGKSSQLHQAPYGSITIASEPLTEDENFPKGFYLRRINGVLWLRGYIADDQHVWEPDDHFIFCHQKKTLNK